MTPEFYKGVLAERKAILKIIDKEAKRQYEEFTKETNLKLSTGWEGLNINRIKLKNAICDYRESRYETIRRKDGGSVVNKNRGYNKAKRGLKKLREFSP